tara:strand:- start:157 stop:492 length:336 start_codon:yes stop_codon:yes gene_type:complete
MNTYLKNALSGLCPLCGQDNLFLSWSKMKERCGSCDAIFIEKNGDNWFFLLIVDRALFIFPIIVAYYFNIEPYTLITISILLLILFITLTPFRLTLTLILEHLLSKILHKG